MHMKTKLAGCTSAIILSGSIAIVSTLALDTKTNTAPSTPPGVTVDEKPLDRGGLRASYSGTIKRVAPSRDFKAGDTKGALVCDVLAKSPAAKAGMESGDIITQFDGAPVIGARELKLAVAQHKPGEKADLRVLREGTEKTFAVTLGELPGDKAAKAKHEIGKADDAGTLNGVGVGNLDQQERREFNIPAEVQGALVTSVDDSTPAWEAGLRPGDVIEQINRQPVRAAEDAVKLTEKSAGKHTLLRVRSGGTSHFLTVDETADAKSRFVYFGMPRPLQGGRGNRAEKIAKPHWVRE